jgi:hypothetical protein
MITKRSKCKLCWHPDRLHSASLCRAFTSTRKSEMQLSVLGALVLECNHDRGVWGDLATVGQAIGAAIAKLSKR